MRENVIECVCCRFCRRFKTVGVNIAEGACLCVSCTRLQGANVHTSGNLQRGKCMSAAVRAEMVATQWRDLDFADCSLRGSRNLGRLENLDKNIDAKTIIAIDEPKTKSSKRTIPLSDDMV